MRIWNLDQEWLYIEDPVQESLNSNNPDPGSLNINDPDPGAKLLRIRIQAQL